MLILLIWSMNAFTMKPKDVDANRAKMEERIMKRLDQTTQENRDILIRLDVIESRHAEFVKEYNDARDGIRREILEELNPPPLN